MYKATFDALSIGAIIVTREDRETFILVDANPASATVGGWRGRKRQEIVGKNMYDVFEKIQESGIIEKYNEVLDSGKAMHLSAFPYEDPKTPYGVFNIDLFPLSDESILITYTNVMEQVQAEENLSASEARFNAMTASFPDYIMQLDLDGSIQYINRTVPDLTVEKVLNTPIYKYVPENNHAVMKACFARVLETAHPDMYEAVYVSNDGSKILFETNVGPIFHDGEVVAFISSSRDITSHRQAELTLNSLSIQLLEAQEAERSRIAQELHDEVGGLLASIQISLELIPVEQKSSIPQLQDLSSLVDTLIEQVRSLSLTLRPDILDELGLKEAIIQFIDRYSTQTKIRVNFSCSLKDNSRFLPEIETAAYRLVQESLTNVARHAQVDEATVELTSSDEELMVVVSDEGKGFQVATNSDARKTLGLSGMHLRASLLGGEVNVSTSPGSGTEIKARFPLARSFTRQATKSDSG